MAMNPEDIVQLIQQKLPEALIKIKDFQGDRDHYTVVITSPNFRGKTRIEQHKMVYEALDGYVGGKLHALSVQTKIPE